jgi:hypothetical protein
MRKVLGLPLQNLALVLKKDRRVGLCVHLFVWQLWVCGGVLYYYYGSSPRPTGDYHSHAWPNSSTVNNYSSKLHTIPELSLRSDSPRSNNSNASLQKISSSRRIEKPARFPTRPCGQAAEAFEVATHWPSSSPLDERALVQGMIFDCEEWMLEIKLAEMGEEIHRFIVV